MVSQASRWDRLFYITINLPRVLDGLMIKNRDTQLGKYIASVVSEKSSDEECPSMAALSRLMDNQCHGVEREEIMAHLNRCPGCYALLSEAMAVSDDLLSGSRPQLMLIWVQVAENIKAVIKPLLETINNSLKPLVAVPALAILVFIFVTVYNPYTEPDYRTLVSSLDSAPRLNLTEGNLLTDMHKSAVYGFFDGLSLERAAFRIGVLAHNLEIATRIKDKQQSLLLIAPMISLLNGIDTGGEIVQEFKTIKARLEAGSFPDSVSRPIDKIPPVLEKQQVSFFMLFGTWVQASNFAASRQDISTFDQRDLSFYIKKTGELELPPGITSSLTSIESVLERENLSPDDFKAINAEFDAIMQILM